MYFPFGQCYISNGFILKVRQVFKKHDLLFICHDPTQGLQQLNYYINNTICVVIVFFFKHMAGIGFSLTGQVICQHKLD